MDHSLSPLVRGPRVMAAVAGSLLVESGALRGQRFLLPLPPSSLILGRDAACSICFPSSAEADRLMGRRHAQVDTRTNGVFLVDLNSANGTLVQLLDGRIQPLVGELQLQNGMRIALGGEDGTWIGVQIVEDADTDASEPMTVRLPSAPTPSLGEAVHRPPSVPPPLQTSATLSQPAPPAFADHLAPPPPIGHGYAASESQSAQGRPVSPRPRNNEERAPVEAASVVQDQELRRHRLLLFRQIAAILAIVLLGCVIGVVLGIRAPQEDAAATP